MKVTYYVHGPARLTSRPPSRRTHTCKLTTRCPLDSHLLRRLTHTSHDTSPSLISSAEYTHFRFLGRRALQDREREAAAIQVGSDARAVSAAGAAGRRDRSRPCADASRQDGQARPR